MLDVTLLALFGTALSSVVNFFLSSQGQISAVGTIVSSGYGFICGAYMPISSFSEGLKNIISFLPGTYGTSIVRNHSMRGVLKELESLKLPNEVMDSLKDALDFNLYFFDNKVDNLVKYVVLVASIVLLVGVYIILNKFKKRA